MQIESDEFLHTIHILYGYNSGILYVTIIPSIVLQSAHLKEGLKMSFIENAWQFNCSIQDQLKEAILPLDNLEIDYFTYSKIWKDGKAFIITNEPPFHKIYESLPKKGLYFTEPLKQAHQNGEFTYIWPDSAIQSLKERGFENYNGINFYLDRGEYIETWCYSSSQFNGEKTNYYLNNLSFLKKYINHFKSNLNELIYKNEDDLLIRFPAPNLEEDINIKKIERIPSHTGHKYYYSYGGLWNYVTIQELRCLIYLAKGYCPLEIAKILEIKERTVRKHFENVNLKFRLNFLNDLRKLAIELEKSF